MSCGRLIIDPPAAGISNMAVDQALLETANERGILTVRFYSWDQPTLSLGYFQKYQQRTDHPHSSSCPVVRRSTGGGAILHDHEITYSICVPSQNRWSTDHEQLYWKMHQLIVDLLRDFSIPAGLFDEGASNYPPNYDANAFLCFQRRTPGDVTLAGFKIAGSAQRRKQNAILQHGSLILGRSPQAPQLPGIVDLVDHLDGDQIRDFHKLLLEEWQSRVTSLFAEHLEKGTLIDSELEVAQKWSSAHQSEAWLRKR